MIFSFPVLAIFSTALLISHGERNCPFFKFTARPVFPVATRRSVCRARNAGICKTSHTFAAGATCPTSWTSAKIGSLNCRLIFARIRSPSLSPGPRNDFSDERLALSYEALKIYGTPWSPAMRWMLSAIFMACASFSITHGPAIRKRGWAPPMRTFPTAISRVFIFPPPKPCESLRLFPSEGRIPCNLRLFNIFGSLFKQGPLTLSGQFWYTPTRSPCLSAGDPGRQCRRSKGFLTVEGAEDQRRRNG